MDATWGACRRRVRGRWTSRQPLAIELCVPVPMRQPEYRNEARHAPTHDRLRRPPRLHCTRPGFHDARMEDASVRVRARERPLRKIGRASCRERVCQYVKITVVGVSLKKKKKK